MPLAAEKWLAGNGRIIELEDGRSVTVDDLLTAAQLRRA